MSGRKIHKVSPELTQGSQYKHPANIESAAMTQGSTVLLYPGVYDAWTANLDDIALVGVGDVDEVILSTFNLNNGSANVITVENVTIRGVNLAVTSGTSAFHALGNDNNAVVKFKGVKFTNAEFAITYHGNSFTGGNAASHTRVFVDRVDTSLVDRAIRGNCNVDIRHSVLNLSANTYFSNTGGAGLKTVFVYGNTSASGGVNAAGSGQTRIAGI